MAGDSHFQAGFFEKASNIHIESSQFICNGHGRREPNGLRILRSKYTVSNATHNTVAWDGLIPELHPQTRKKTLDFIMNWIKKPDPQHKVLWLNAPLGHGKTAVMQKIAELLQASNSIDHAMAANFFFSRGQPGRDVAKYLVPTIAYQISQNIREMQPYIDEAMINDPTIPSKLNLDTQIQGLILDPFDRYSLPISNEPVVIIDGLDECCGITDPGPGTVMTEADKRAASIAAQTQILDIIAKAVSLPHCPLRFLIASRPEYHINHFFCNSSLLQHSQRINFEESLEESTDIRTYLQHDFHLLRSEWEIEEAWPSDEDLQVLVEKASGQFLYAKTALKFLRSGLGRPRQLLQSIMRCDQSTRAFSEIDCLYIQILAACPGIREDVQQLLGIGAYLHDYKRRATVSTLAEILGRTKGEVKMALRGLYAVVDVNEREDIPEDASPFVRMHCYSPKVRVRHNSFIDFLLDEDRSGKYHVNFGGVHDWLIERVDTLIGDGLFGSEKSILHTGTSQLLVNLGKFSDDAAGHCSQFPYFHRFLNEIMQPQYAIPDKCGTRFVHSLYIAMDILADMGGHCRHKSFQDCRRVCLQLIDEAWKRLIPPLHHFKNIVYTLVKHSIFWPDISTVSRALGASEHETLDLLFQYSCFVVDDNKVKLPAVFCQFAENEFRSGDLHILYRDSWIRAILAELSNLLNITPNDMICFSIFKLVERFYNKPSLSDINLDNDSDLRNAALVDLMDFVPKFLNGSLSVIGENKHGIITMCLLIRWLERQQKKVQSADNNRIVTKLQAVINKINWNSITKINCQIKGAHEWEKETFFF